MGAAASRRGSEPADGRRRADPTGRRPAPRPAAGVRPGHPCLPGMCCAARQAQSSRCDRQRSGVAIVGLALRRPGGAGALPGGHGRRRCRVRGSRRRCRGPGRGDPVAGRTGRTRPGSRSADRVAALLDPQGGRAEGHRRRAAGADARSDRHRADRPTGTAALARRAGHRRSGPDDGPAAGVRPCREPRGSRRAGASGSAPGWYDAAGSLCPAPG